MLHLNIEASFFSSKFCPHLFIDSTNLVEG